MIIVVKNKSCIMNARSLSLHKYLQSTFHLNRNDHENFIHY
jgi:hypothetical protein